jgi:hypothetical protein
MMPNTPGQTAGAGMGSFINVNMKPIIAPAISERIISIR